MKQQLFLKHAQFFFVVVVAQSQVSVGQKAKNLNYKYVVVLREKRLKN